MAKTRALTIRTTYPDELREVPSGMRASLVSHRLGRLLDGCHGALQRAVVRSHAVRVLEDDGARGRELAWGENGG